MSKIKEAQNDWEDWQRKVNIDLDPSEPAFFEQLDVGLKYDMFYTAVHYWEGRWLMATRTALEENRLSRNGERDAKERWQRFAMLTPCFVSTFIWPQNSLATPDISGSIRGRIHGKSRQITHCMQLITS